MCGNMLRAQNVPEIMIRNNEAFAALILLFSHETPCFVCRCSVCLADYQAEDKLQRIPACGHAFHMDCIDHWLTTHTTCPLCRLSLLAPPKSSSESPYVQEETSQESSVTENSNETYDQQRSQAVVHSESRNEAGAIQNSPKEQGRSPHSLDQERDATDARNEAEEHDHSRGMPGNF